jgi:predicted flavoprotein YhiN
MPNQFCIGEMLDWDAGGYLLQAASTGVFLANYLNEKVKMT